MSTATDAMFLVDDETVDLPILGKSVQFRVRVWRARGCPAVVLATRSGSGPAPSSATCRLAGFVYRAMLAFAAEGMDYFEADGGKLDLVTFEGIGTQDRLKLTRPRHAWVSHDEFDSLIGTHVEL